MQVRKRNGSFEDINVEKLHKVVMYACDGINNVSASEVEINSHIQFHNGISSSDIQETLIKSAADLISEETPNYQYVAGRLINYHLRKSVYGQFDPPPLLSIIKKNIDLGFYDKEILEKYSEEELGTLNSYTKHERDDVLTYAAMEQFRGKYLVQNRTTGEIFETPQIAYMLISATIFRNYPKATRMRYVKDYYDAISTFEISLPTPVMAGLRTPQRQFSSCVLIETDDSLDSINATTSAIVKYVSQKAGIGIGAGRIRAIGSPIRNGDTSHTGVIPFYRLFQSAVKSCSQGSVRSGSATLFYPIWHLEIEDMLVLKNNKGTCTLSAINFGVFKDKEDMEKACTLAVRALDEVLDYQDYPVKAARTSTMLHRPLGIGIINFAYWLAKNDTTYQNPNLELIDEWTEAWSYYLIKASADLAIEKGAIPGIFETKYGLGITPNMTYKKDVDTLVPNKERMDWVGLRKQLKETGIRNSTLMALMPSETSSQVSNSTNGIEPPRAFVSSKQSKHGVLKQVVPGYPRLKNKYDLLWDQKSPEGYLKIVAVLQKYIDQAISVNTSYNPKHFENEEIPMSVLLKDILFFYKMGGKNLYYNNVMDGQGEQDVTRTPELSKTDLDNQDENCESCVI